MFFKLIGEVVVGIVYLAALGFIEVTLEDWLSEETKWSVPTCRLASCGLVAFFWWTTMFLGAWMAMGVSV